MTMEEFRQYQEENFDAFSKSTIKHINAKLLQKRTVRANRETVFSALSFQERQALFTEDRYSLEDDGICFSVLGQPVVVRDRRLGQALFALPPKRRDVILLCYFAGWNEPQIARRLNLSRSTVNRRRSTTLNRLKKMLETMEHET